MIYLPTKKVHHKVGAMTNKYEELVIMRCNGLVISFRTESWMAKDDLSESMTTPAIQHYYKSII